MTWVKGWLRSAIFIVVSSLQRLSKETEIQYLRGTKITTTIKSSKPVASPSLSPKKRNSGTKRRKK